MPKKIYPSSLRRRQRRHRLLIILLLTLLVSAACFAFLFFSPSSGVGEISGGLERDGGQSKALSQSALEESSEPSQPASPVSAPAPASSSPSSEEVSSLPEESSGESSEEPSGYAAYDFAQPVPESGSVDDSYFDNVVFVGNSRTQGFVLYAGLSNITAYTDKGLTVETAATKEIVPAADGKQTVLEALGRNDSCKAVYMMFGINELGWSYENVFVEKYADLVDVIQQNHPNVEIYLQSILPVGKTRAEADRYVNNDRIQEFNGMIQQLAADKQVYYLNVWEAVADEEGALPEDAAADGVHLRKPYCQKWLEYLKTHIAPDIPEPAREAGSWENVEKAVDESEGVEAS